MKPGNVSWSKIYTPKKEGGLGIKNLELWNTAVIGKLAWHIYIMQESLWVKLVHGVYTEGGNWLVYNSPPTIRWTMRKICQVKEKLKQWVSQDTYCIGRVYKANSCPQPRVWWDKIVSHRSSAPKAQFVLWLAMRNKLKTKSRLMSIGVTQDNLCPIYGLVPETVEHLLSKCTYSANCLLLLQNWLNVKIPMRNIWKYRR